jgi:hypothetical protein
VDPADALSNLLLTAGVAAAPIPPGTEARAACWRDWVSGRRVLLLLDDEAGHEQVQPLLPGTTGSMVLVTSRRRLAALQDATVIRLDVLSPAEAAALLAGLAAGQYFATWASAYRRPPPGRSPALVPDLSTPARAGAWLETERPNLHVAADCAQFAHAIAISGAISGFLAANGHWDQSATLIHTALTAARRAGNRLGEADTLGDLGVLRQEAATIPAPQRASPRR